MEEFCKNLTICPYYLNTNIGDYCCYNSNFTCSVNRICWCDGKKEKCNCREFKELK